MILSTHKALMFAGGGTSFLMKLLVNIARSSLGGGVATVTEYVNSVVIISQKESLSFCGR